MNERVEREREREIQGTHLAFAREFEKSLLKVKELTCKNKQYEDAKGKERTTL